MVKVGDRTADIGRMGFDCLECGKTCPEGRGPFCGDECRERRAKQRRDWYVTRVLPAGARWRRLAGMALLCLGLSILTGSWFWAMTIYGAGGFFWFRSQVARSRVSLLADDPSDGERRILRLALWPVLFVNGVLSP